MNFLLTSIKDFFVRLFFVILFLAIGIVLLVQSVRVAYFSEMYPNVIEVDYRSLEYNEPCRVASEPFHSFGDFRSISLGDGFDLYALHKDDKIWLMFTRYKDDGFRYSHTITKGKDELWPTEKRPWPFAVQNNIIDDMYPIQIPGNPNVFIESVPHKGVEILDGVFCAGVIGFVLMFIGILFGIHMLGSLGEIIDSLKEKKKRAAQPA